MDHKALNHILASTHIYQKPESAIYNVKRILGAGVLLVEGEAHKRQRKALVRHRVFELGRALG
jgi:hypothetical protein